MFQKDSAPAQWYQARGAPASRCRHRRGRPRRDGNRRRGRQWRRPPLPPRGCGVGDRRRRRIESLPISWFRSPQSPTQIARAMQHADDFHAVVDRSIKDRIPAERQAAQ
jgi:hypothetical protein